MTETTSTLAARRERRLRGAFVAEEHESQDRAARVRLAALAVIAVWLAVEEAFPAALYYEALLVVFALFGFAPLWLRRLGLDARWQRYGFAFLDSALLAFTLVFPNPMCSACDWMPPAWYLKFDNEPFFFIVIGAAVFSYSPRVVLWTGLMAALTWSLGMLWILNQPGSFSMQMGFDVADMSVAERIAVLTDPQRVDVGNIIKVDLVFLIVAGVLAAAVHRTRRLALRQAQAERDRANLARHFSPNMVDEISRHDRPMGEVRREDVAVLFVDIVGFTRTSENEAPERVIALLREFHHRMADRVFAHEGTLDKFLGDGLMATFGTPHPRPDDAQRALACARDMAADIAAWNQQRVSAGEPPLRAGIGLHFGPVVLGDIGDERRLEFAVIGDTVNVASRLEEMTRELGVDVIASNDVIARARQGGPAVIFDGLVEGAQAVVRGRDDPIAIWTLRAA